MEALDTLKRGTRYKNILLMVMVVLSILLGVQAVEAATVEEIIGGSDLFESSVYYILNGKLYYKNGTNVTEESYSDLLEAIRLDAKTMFTESGNGSFTDTTIFPNWGYSGGLESYDYLEKPFASLIFGPGSNSGFMEIQMDSTYKIGLPIGDVPVENEYGEIEYIPKTEYYRDSNEVEYTRGLAAEGASAAYQDIILAMKEGIIVGGVTHGINVGVAYADEPIELNRVMTERPAKGYKIVNGVREEYEVGGKVWEFNSSSRNQAVMEYFMSPLFGRIELSDVPTTEAEWDAMAPEVKITQNSVVLDVAYQQFLDQEASSETGLKPATGVVFENGVEKYKKDLLESSSPKSYLDYNMTVILPTVFYRSTQEMYQALKVPNTESAKTKPVEDFKISVYNDNMHEILGDNTLKLYCPITDLDLTREFIHLYHYIDGEGQKRGAIIVLRYDETVVDPNTQEVYMTGRKIHFGGNFMTSIVIDTPNRDSLYVSTKISGKTGVAPREVSFPIPESAINDAISIYDDTNNKYHTEINKNHQYISFNIDFREVKVGTSEDGSQYDGPAKRFIMTRNNFYVKDGELIEWLRTDEARGMKGVLAEELRKKIQGEMSEFEAITFAEWMRMEEIKGQLRKDKDETVPRAIGTVMIILGTFFIVAGIILPFIYLFDIFNTVTELSILHLISSGRMYPVEHKDNIVPQGLMNETILVNFVDIMKMTVVTVLIGGFFYEIDLVLAILIRIYSYIAQFVL